MSGLLKQLARSRLANARGARFEVDRVRREEAERARLATAFLDFIPKVTPRFQPPYHLSALADLFERAETEPIRAVISVPPRHAKTETLLHAIAWRLLRHPDWTTAYASYSLPFAHSKSRSARDYAMAAGVEIRDDAAALSEWRTPAGGGLLATSVGGHLTGHGAHLLIVDDPHKDRASAESASDRDFIYDWFRGTAITRIEPGGAILVVHTRWSCDDLIGRLAADKEVHWECVNLPAIDDNDEALWPERWTVEALKQRRLEVGEYDWWSQYQGTPQPKGNVLFGDVHFYDELPREGYRMSVGVDFAYTKKTRADYSVAVVMMRKGNSFFVVDVIRHQELANEFYDRLKLRYDNGLKGARWRSYVSTTEKGITDIMSGQGLPVDGILAKGDKYVRATPVACAWNRGEVLVPHKAPWLSAFLSELKVFTGVSDRNDDQVDAFAAAFDALAGGNLRIVPPPTSLDQYRLSGTRGF